jgi:hypothetical protein
MNYPDMHVTRRPDSPYRYDVHMWFNDGKMITIQENVTAEHVSWMRSQSDGLVWRHYD